jgi:O-acetyl-ADP-ribose deacetylase (regulator of RNase III)
MQYVMGDLLSVESGIIVHGCNAQGVMGSGVAKVIRDKYPDAYIKYRKKFDESGLKTGEIVWYKVTDNPRFVIANAITQEFYGRDSKCYVDYEAIRKTFSEIAIIATKYNLNVYYPRIGAGLGGGDWNLISEIINSELNGINHYCYVPQAEWNLVSKNKNGL